MKKKSYPWSFWGGLAVRLLLFPFFGSYYLKDLFIPFIDSAVQNVGQNPWSLNPPHFFPYGSVQFLLFFIPKWIGYQLFGQAALGASLLSLSLMKLPLLVMDFFLFRILSKIAKRRTDNLITYYWLNPIVLYVLYVHGQLDIVSMAFCVASIALLIEQLFFASALVMACALLCKFQVVAVIPLMMAYIWNNQFSKKAMRIMGMWLAIVLGFTAIGFSPLALAGRIGYVTSQSPEAFRIFSLVVDLGNNQHLYVGLLLVIAVLGRLVASARLTAQGLLFGSGIVFGCLVLVTNPGPGWYLWVLPFISLFFSIYSNVPSLLYWLFCSFYLLYFLLIQPFEANLNPLITGISFTTLQTSLFGILVALWTVVVRQGAQLQGRATPFWIGIAGDSGSGKNTLSSLLEDVFGGPNVVIMEGDDYHKWERGHQRWRDYTHLHPRANDLMSLAAHTRELDRGLPVFHPRYDHSTGNFTPPREIKPGKTVIVQGLHTFYLKGTRNLYDLKIFLAPFDSVRLAWKVRRDVLERGHEYQNVVQSIARREPDSKTHIQPQRNLADWVIEYLPNEPVTEEDILNGKNIDLKLRFTLWNDAPIGKILRLLAQIPNVEITYENDDIDRMTIVISGHPNADQIQELASLLFPNLRHITRANVEPTWREGLAGVTQLIAVTLAGARYQLFDTPANA